MMMNLAWLGVRESGLLSKPSPQSARPRPRSRRVRGSWRPPVPGCARRPLRGPVAAPWLHSAGWHLFIGTVLPRPP
jgi:hypothetical protein